MVICVQVTTTFKNRQTQIDKVRPLTPEPRYVGVRKLLKSCQNSPEVDKILAVLIQAGGNTLTYVLKSINLPHAILFVTRKISEGSSNVCKCVH